MRLDQVAAVSREVELAGSTFRVSPLTLHQLAQLQAWLVHAVIHPLKAIRPYLEGLAADDRSQLLSLAYADARRWPPQVGTEEANSLLFSPAGQAEFLYVVLSRHHPDMTREAARDLAGRMSVEEFGVLSRAANGKMDVDGDDEVAENDVGKSSGAK